MARNLTPVGKLSRREGIRLHPKAVKALTRKNYAPGQHGQSRRMKPSDFALQLREKQKVKRIYGLLEKQFRRVVNEAIRTEGPSGEKLLELLERRLDNTVYRLGLAPSRQAARQLVSHAHIFLNGKRVDIPSIIVKPGDEISVRERSAKNAYFTAMAAELAKAKLSVGWLSFDAGKLKATVTGLPTREDAETEIEEQLIIEYYSR